MLHQTLQLPGQLQPIEFKACVRGRIDEISPMARNWTKITGQPELSGSSLTGLVSGLNWKNPASHCEFLQRR